MAGTTAFPGAIDTFPTINPNTQENIVSHSGVHENVHAAVLALQEKVGVDGSADPTSFDARIDALETSGPGGGGGGFTVTVGDPNGAPLEVGQPHTVVLPKGYVLSDGWFLLALPSGSITLDLRLEDFPDFPDAGDSITGGNLPAVVGDTSASGDLTGWSLTLAENGVLQLVPTANSGVCWISLKVR